MLNANLRDYSDPYIHFEGTVTVPDTETGTDSINRNKKVIFKIVLYLLIA